MIKKTFNKLFFLIYTHFSAELWMKLNNDRKIRRIARLLKGNNLTTLEVGAAEGYITRKLALWKVISRGTAFDILKKRLDKGRRRAKKEGVDVDFIQGHANNLPFDDNEYDYVLLLDVLEHIETKRDVIKSLKEAYRVAKKGLIISVPQLDSTDFLPKIAKYIDLDHLRILLFYNNSWIYSKFPKALEELKFNYRRVSLKRGIYIVNKKTKKSFFTY